MGSDLARISYDPSRQYRSVVAQQGRVTLEADSNEGEAIADEALRLETIDIVGPAGTPNDGYKVEPGTKPGEVAIGPGIFYLGGWRLTLPKAVNIAAQPDWLDQPALTLPTGDTVISLLITEQSVAAVEDQALRDVALGGPDTAARTRLMQHFLALPSRGATCDAGATAVAALLKEDGVALDAKTLQLISSARLQVGFVPPSAPPDPCSPAAQGGYLGADNQLIRVTVTSFDPTTRTGTLLWGWNNASFLYRATATDAQTLTLASVPVDQEHAPQLGQIVEILRSRANLGDENYIAADAGAVSALTQAYSFDTGQLKLTTPLTGDYLTDKPPLFVRVWQASVAFTAGQATALDSVSGITVTIAMTALPNHIAARPFWHFAVRPNTPVQVYPQRYQQAGQPPDGPRQWLCDLAIIGVSAGATTNRNARQPSPITVLADCRIPFVPLTQQQDGTCCGLTLDPAGVAAKGGLQAVLDTLAGTNGSLTLRPGTYTLAAPITLTAKHAGITLQGCGGGVKLNAAAASVTAFAFGLIVLQDAAAITLRSLEFDLPNAPQGTPGRTGTAQTFTLIGIVAAIATDLTIEDCFFNYAAPSARAFGVGILGLGNLTGMSLRRNRFAAPTFLSGSDLFGLVVTVMDGNTSTVLSDAEIADNRFQNIAIGGFFYAQLGQVRCSSNRVQTCAAGFLFAASNLGATGVAARDAFTLAARDQSTTTLAGTFQAGLQAPLIAKVLQNTAPFAAKLPPATVAPTVSDVATRVLTQDITTRGKAAWSGLATAPAAPTQEARAPAARTPRAAASTAPSSDLVEALNMIDRVSIAAEVAGYTLAPVLEIRDNDVALGATGTTAAGFGISVIFSPRDESGTILLNGNRVAAPDTGTNAAFVLFPAFAVVTGNMFVQTQTRPKTGGPVVALAVWGENTDRFSSVIEVMGNVIQTGSSILPARATGAATTSWDFLNTTEV